MPAMAEFEARRAVGQLARSTECLRRTVEQRRPDVKVHPTLHYLAAAKELTGALQAAIGDLVAEARACGVTWRDIGRALGGVLPTAVQNRYGNGLEDARLQEIEDSAWAVLVARGFVGSGEDEGETDDEVEGTTPAERWEYAFELIRRGVIAANELESEVSRGDPNLDTVNDRLYSLKNKIARLTLTLLTQEQWQAMAGWSNQADDPHAANYYQPVTYLYYVMHQILIMMRRIGLYCWRVSRVKGTSLKCSDSS